MVLSAFTPRASADIEEASRWYERERAGLGAEFQEELWRALDLLALTPEMGPVAHRDVRRILLHRFPYAVYYRLAAAVIEIQDGVDHRT